MELDRQRAAAGLEQYRARRWLAPESAWALIEGAAYFHPAPEPLAPELAGKPGIRFPTRGDMENATCR